VIGLLQIYIFNDINFQLITSLAQSHTKTTISGYIVKKRLGQAAGVVRNIIQKELDRIPISIKVSLILKLISEISN